MPNDFNASDVSHITSGHVFSILEVGGKMFSKGVGEFIVVNCVFDVLEMLVHSQFEFLLSVANTVAAGFFTSGFTHCNGLPAVAIVDAFSIHC